MNHEFEEKAWINQRINGVRVNINQDLATQIICQYLTQINKHDFTNDQIRRTNNIS